MEENKFSVDTLHHNLDLLRSLTGKKKGEFSEYIGVWNLYRNDIKSIGAKLLKAIEDNFSGVDKNWLMTYHESLDDGIIFTPRKNIPKNESSTLEFSESESVSDNIQTRALILTSKIMSPKHPDIAEALMKNLEAFAQAAEREDELKFCRKEIDIQKREIDLQRKEIEALKRDNDALNDKINDMAAKIEDLIKQEPPGDSGAPGDPDPVPGKEEAM